MTRIDITVGAGPAVADNMKHGVNCAFFIRNAVDQAPPSYYRNLIASAELKIVIWDPYFHDTDARIFSVLTHTLNVTILTKKSGQRKAKYFEDCENAIISNVPDAVKSGCNFFLYFVDTDRHSEVWQCHDRFLIIDDSRVFIIGASIAHHLEVHDSTGIYEVVEDEDKALIADAFQRTLTQSQHGNTYKKITL